MSPYNLKAGEKVFTEFISLEKAIENAAEKLTQSYKFRIESVEFCYGLTEIYEDKFYNTPGAKTFEYIPISVYASPVWIIDIPKTGIAETPKLRIIVDALTGETEVLH